MESTELGGIALAIATVIGVFICACIAVGYVIYDVMSDDDAEEES